jgi:hypothetical protein
MGVASLDVEVSALVSWALTEAEAAPRRKPPPWSTDEDGFLRANLGVLSEEEIAAALGRTPTAVHLRWSRDLGLPAPSKDPAYVTAHRAARMLGVDVHAVCGWIERGWLPARRLPFRDRKVWRIRLEHLKRFAIRPEHWILFRPERVRDHALARLVAEMHGVDHRDVNRFVRAGKLPAVKWNNWRIRRSDAWQAYFPKGRGSGHVLDWSEEGDAFLVLARAVGLSLAEIARRMKRPAEQVRLRLATLHRRGQIPFLLGKYGIEGVLYRENGRLLADWREHRGRFPALARAMDLFAAGRRLSPAQAERVRGVLWAWAAFYLGDRHPLARRLQCPHSRSKTVPQERLQALYLELQRAGVDPLG